MCKRLVNILSTLRTCLPEQVAEGDDWASIVSESDVSGASLLRLCGVSNSRIWVTCLPEWEARGDDFERIVSKSNMFCASPVRLDGGISKSGMGHVFAWARSRWRRWRWRRFWQNQRVYRVTISILNSHAEIASGVRRFPSQRASGVDLVLFGCGLTAWTDAVKISPH